ncbi:MAG: DUF6557 family protein [Clostridiaceae bacterium]
MKSRKECIMERMALLSDESLVRIITDEAGEYELDAQEIAKEELKNRCIDIDAFFSRRNSKTIPCNSDICEENPVTLNDIIHNIDYSLVEKVLYDMHPEDLKFSSDYKSFFEKLLQMSPIISKSILIKIEKEQFDADDPSNFIWVISGLDIESGEKLNLELSTWNEWLGFHVRPEDLKSINQETFVSLCLYQMTMNGFSEEDRESNLKLRKNEGQANSYLFGTNTNRPDFIHDNVFISALEYKKSHTADEALQIRPWTRLWARSMDYSLIFFIFLILNKSVLHTEFNMRLLGISIIPLIQALIETPMLHFFGTTPGKWLLQIRICNPDGCKLSYKNALKRSFMVWLFGEAIGLNTVLNTFAYLVSYYRLSYSGKTYWDDKNKVCVIHKKIGILRGIVFITIFQAMFVLIWSILY